MMRYLLLFLIFVSCKEDDIMIVSKSLPIEFYINGELTYSQDTTDGIYQACFCHMVNYLDDQIVIQVKHPTGQNLTAEVYHEGDLIYSNAFTEVSTGVYVSDFFPTLDMVGKKTNILIVDDSAETQLLLNSGFDSDLSSWSASGWTHADGAAVYEFSRELSSAEISQNISNALGVYRVVFDWSFNDYGEGSYNAFYRVEFTKNNSVVDSFTATTLVNPSSSLSIDKVYIVGGSFDKISLYIELTDQLPSISGSPTVIPLASLDNWVDEGFDWFIDANPDTNLESNTISSDIRSPYNLITSSEYSNKRILTVDYDLINSFSGIPDRVELNPNDFNDESTWSALNDSSYGSSSVLDFGGSPAEYYFSLAIIYSNTDPLNEKSKSVSKSFTEISSLNYGRVKEIEIDWHSTDFSTDQGLTTIYCELYNDGIFLEEQSFQYVQGDYVIDPYNKDTRFTTVFEFDTENTFDQVKFRLEKNTYEVGDGGEDSSVRIWDVRLYHYEQFSYMDLTAELRLNSDPISGGSKTVRETLDLPSRQAVFEFEVSGDMNNVSLQFANGPGGRTIDIEITNVTFTAVENTPTISLELLQLYGVPFLAQSQCIEVKDNHTLGLGIEYNNNSDFDNIDYGSSPSPSFKIRIPAQFWKQQFTKEFENYAKSNDEYTRVYDQMQEKRLLEIGHVPYFMHRKINRILMHDNIIINGEYWICRDEYENEPLNRYSKSKSQVWLTKKDGITRNVL